MTTDNENIRLFLEAALDEDRLQDTAQLLVHLHPADIAYSLEKLGEDEKIGLFQQLDTGMASRVIAELSEFSRDQILESLSHQQIIEIVERLDSDDAADLLAGVPVEIAEKVLTSIDVKDSSDVRRLLAYGEETAGGIMQAELLAIPQNMTVSDTIQYVRQHGEDLDRIHDVFVVNKDNQVVGQLSLQRLILSNPDERVETIMTGRINPIPVNMDQEEVAHLFQKYDILSAPVVDDNGTLLGRITIDDIVDVIEEEVSEDLLRMGGTHEDELVYGDQIWKISRYRLPWLLTTLLGGLLTGYLLWLFKVALADAIVLVTFVPVIMALGGSVAIQSTTITVRGIATGQIDLQRLGRTIFKEIRVGLLMALACGLTLGVVAEIWHRNPALGLSAGLSLAMVIVVASIMGTFIPVVFQKLGIDPAVSSGPFVTIANDISGLLIYLTTSTAFLKYIV